MRYRVQVTPARRLDRSLLTVVTTPAVCLAEARKTSSSSAPPRASNAYSVHPTMPGGGGGVIVGPRLFVCEISAGFVMFR